MSIEEFQKEYVRTARSKGLKEQVIVINHALKNALIPALTIVGLLFGTVALGSFLVERVFGWNGLGSLMKTAIDSGNRPLIMGGVITAAIMFIIINTLSDLLYAYLDPRLRQRTE